MKQPHAHITFLFVTLGIVAILLLLTDMATGDTCIYPYFQSMGGTHRR